MVNPENPKNPDSKTRVPCTPISFTPTFADTISGTEADLPLSTI